MLICINPSVQVKSIKPDALMADRELYQAGTHVPVESIPIHAEIARCIFQTDDPRLDLLGDCDGFRRLFRQRLFRRMFLVITN